MTRFDAATLQYHLQPTLWNRFQEHVLRVWTHYTDNLKPFLIFLNKPNQQVSLNLQIHYGFGFLDLKMLFEKFYGGTDIVVTLENS